MNRKIALFSILIFSALQPGYPEDHAWRLRYRGGYQLGVGINPLNPNTVFALQRDDVFPSQSDSLIVSYDRGITWNVLSIQPVGYLGSLILHTVDTLVMFSAYFHDLSRSSDYGLTWTSVLSAPSWLESVEIDPISPDKLYAGVLDGNIYRSTDRGVNWEAFSRIDSGLCDLAIRPDSTNIFYAGTEGASFGKIWKSTDEGFSWRVTATTTEYAVSHIAIDFYNPSVAYATTAEGPQQGVWKTSDWGEHWGPVFINYHGWYVDIDRGSPGVPYVLDDKGTAPVRSTDEGVSWEALEEGFPETFASGIKAHPLDGTIVWAGFGDGVYRWASLASTVEGRVLDDETGEAVTNGFVELASTGERVMLDTSGGTYALHYYEDDPTLSSTIHVEAFPYSFHDEPVDFTLDSTTTYDIRLTKLPVSSIAGTVEDSVTHAPVVAEVTLSVSSSLGDTTRSLVTKPDGSFLFDSLFISQPPIISYSDITVHQVFPYASAKFGPFAVDTTQYVLEAPVDTADVMLTSSGSSGDFSTYFTAVLDTLRQSYYSWNPAEEGTAPMVNAAEMRKNVLIYYTGNDTTALPESELDSLNSALSSGVNLFITGQNFVQANASSDFVSQVLELGYAGTTTSSTCIGFAGDLFDGIAVSTNGGTGANNQNSRDILQVVGMAPIATIGWGFGGAGGTAGVRIEGFVSGAKVILIGFGFESINSRLPRQNFMHTILGYFDGSIVVSVQSSASSEPEEYRLEQNYPNPFNPKTDVRYEISDVGFVSLVVYDILGREVATLVNEKKSPGRYSVTWDAFGQASGVYFYRIKAGNFTETKKLLLIR